MAPPIVHAQAGIGERPLLSMMTRDLNFRDNVTSGNLERPRQLRVMDWARPRSLRPLVKVDRNIFVERDSALVRFSLSGAANSDFCVGDKNGGKLLGSGAFDSGLGRYSSAVMRRSNVIASVPKLCRVSSSKNGG